LCRERAATQPRDFGIDAEIEGPRCGPFATQGRSYRGFAFADVSDKTNKRN